MKLSGDFFKNSDTVFLGYSSRNAAYSKSLYKAFTDNGIRIYPVNPRKDASFDVKVYQSLDELPVKPENAYILMNSVKTGEAVKQLKDFGIKRILFHNSKTVSQETLEECRQAGIETAIGCPMMIFGKGLHRFHGFLSGVKK